MARDDEGDRSPDSEGAAMLDSAQGAQSERAHPEYGVATAGTEALRKDQGPELIGTTPVTGSMMLSKSQQKKIRRKQEWEEGRDDRKAKRKEKTKQKKERKRAARTEQNDKAADTMDADGGASVTTSTKPSDIVNKTSPSQRLPRATQLPVTFVIDCQFDSLMTDNEIMSMGSQLTRSYSDNRKARFRAHLAISSFGGRLRDRFDGILEGHHTSWKGVRFLEQDFVVVAEQAATSMQEPGAGAVAGALRHEPQDVDSQEITIGGRPEGAERGEVVYLSSESPDTLTELKPYGIYIIGGLVDRNRHKGVCYKRAMDRGVRTAKLPIGDYMQMRSRAVLATNHVVEIMLKWLEVGDWGKAFLDVIPKRKGGVLKGKDDDVASAGDEEEVVQRAVERNGSTAEEDTKLENDTVEEAADDDFQGGIGSEKLKRKLGGIGEQIEGTKRLKGEQDEDTELLKDKENRGTNQPEDEDTKATKYPRGEHNEEAKLLNKVQNKEPKQLENQATPQIPRLSISHPES